MPTTTNRRIGKSFNSEELIGVLATEAGLRSSRGITADTTNYFTKNSMGNVIIPPGYFWQRLGTGLGRLLPITKAKAATTTAQNRITVHCCQVFKVGDVIVRGATTIGTVQSINADDSIITLTANAAAAVAVGDVLSLSGLVYNDKSVLGFNAYIVSFETNGNDVGLYTSATVYGSRMPQWDATLSAQFPEITTYPIPL